MTSANDGKARGYKAPLAHEEWQNLADWKLDIELWQKFKTLQKCDHSEKKLLLQKVE